MKGLSARIRSLRTHRHLSLTGLAQKTGIDKATLSRIENGKMSGTLDSHMKIAEALGIRLPELYEGVLARHEADKQQRMRGKVEAFIHSTGAVAELLTGGGLLRKKLMPIRLKLKPRGQTEREEYPPYTERFVYVVRGALTVCVGSATHLLKGHDSLHFDASLPHHFQNTSSSDTWCLSVLTPASL